ncbi:MAG: thioredoxin [Burkholderiaceae bacterium]|nr:MAG: thioredoxin [Burkholderiaceae bacterium]
MLFDVNDTDFNEKVLRHDMPVLVDFWAPSCKPCLSMVPTFKSLATQFEGQVAIAKINVDENMGTAGTYKVRGLPTLILFRGGEVVDKKLGAMTEQQIKDWVAHQLGN